MPYMYECRACDAASPARHDQREDAEDEQEQHRAASHGGLVPAAGDGVRRVHAEGRGDGILPAGWPYALGFLVALLVWNWWSR